MTLKRKNYKWVHLCTLMSKNVTFKQVERCSCWFWIVVLDLSISVDSFTPLLLHPFTLGVLNSILISGREFSGLMAANQQPLYTRQEFNLFHAIDRSLYITLVMQLHRDPLESMHIIALFLWLEKAGFNNLVKKMLPLPYLILNEIAEEALACLQIIYNGTHPSKLITDIPLIHSLADNELSLQFLYQHRLLAKQGIMEILNEVCLRAFSDIMEKATKRMNFVASSSSSSLQQRGNFIPADDRTMFVTFSRGYPVCEGEVREFFVKKYGDCIESLHMQEVQAHEQALFAIIVFHSPATIGVVLDGMTRAKFTINGKHVWVRKFVPKRIKHQPTIQFGSLN